MLGCFCKCGVLYVENLNDLLKSSFAKHLTQSWQIWQNGVQDENLSTWIMRSFDAFRTVIKFV